MNEKVLILQRLLPLLNLQQRYVILISKIKLLMSVIGFIISCFTLHLVLLIMGMEG